MEPNYIVITNDTYHNSPEYHDYWSSTQLRNYLKGPSMAKYLHEYPEHKETSAMRLGSLLHEMIEHLHMNLRFPSGEHRHDFALEKFFAFHPIFEPPINPRTGQPYGETTQKYKEAFEEFRETKCKRPSLIVEDTFDYLDPVSTEEANILHIHAQNIENNPFLKAAICNQLSVSEGSHFIEMFGGQVKLKWRPDLETKNFIFDWKTISTDLTDDSVRRRIIDSGYDIQAAMYQSLTYEQTKKWKASLIVWFQTIAPYNIRIDRLNNFAYPVEGGERLDNDVACTHGAMQYERILDAHIYCTTNNTWPTGDVSIEPDERGNRIHDMECPTWATNKIIEFHF